MTTRMLLASPLGFLIGVSLGALGGGGSILAVPVLVYVAGQSASQATTTSLVVVGIASLIGAFGHWRAGRVRVVTGTVFGALGIAGSLAGSALNRRLDGDVLMAAFSALILVAAWRMVVGCPSCTRSGEARALESDATSGSSVASTVRTLAPARVATIAAAGTAVGFLTGLFGVGGGFVVVPALALVLNFPMGAAIGTSLVVVAINAATALAARIGVGTIDWASTALFAAVAVAGVAAGTRVADRVDASTLQRGFAALLVAVALYTGARAGIAIA